jgi:hypothetical protein
MKKKMTQGASKRGVQRGARSTPPRTKSNKLARSVSSNFAKGVSAAAKSVGSIKLPQGPRANVPGSTQSRIINNAIRQSVGKPPR